MSPTMYNYLCLTSCVCMNLVIFWECLCGQVVVLLGVQYSQETLLLCKQPRDV